MYYLNYIRGEFNNWIFSQNTNIKLNYQLDEIPALTPKRKVLWERAQASDFLTLNEKRNLVGYESKPGGDKILIPAHMIPYNENMEPEVPEEQVANELANEGVEDEEIQKLLGYPPEEKPYANEYACRLKNPDQIVEKE
jgi:hypothetical protein